MKFQGFIQVKGNPQDKNDCAVRALAAATGESYPVVSAVLTEYGRKHKRGFDIDGWLRSVGYVAFGRKFYAVRELTEFGHYLCYNNGHAWAVVHGKLADSWEGGRRYTHAFAVEPWDAGEDPKLAEATRRAKLLASI